MRKRLSRLRIALVLLCILFCLTGCGKSESNADPESEDIEAVVDRSNFNWRTSEWKRTNSRGDGEALYIGDFVEYLQHEVDFDYEMRDYLYSRSYETLVCRLDYFMMEDGETRYYMDRYDWDTGETSYTEMDIDSFLEGESMAEICYFDIRSKEEYVFLRVVYEEGYDFSRYGMMRTTRCVAWPQCIRIRRGIY